MRNFIVFCVLLFLVSCSSVKDSIDFGDRLSIISTEGTLDIYSETGVLLGQTPVVISGKKMEEIISDGVVRFEARRNEHYTKQFIIAVKGMSELKISLKKVTQTEYEKYFKNSQQVRLDILLDDVLLFYEKLSVNDIDSLEVIINRLLSDYPNVSRIHFLDAVYSFKKGNLKNTNLSLEKSLLIDSGNEFSRNLQMILNKN